MKNQATNSKNGIRRAVAFAVIGSVLCIGLIYWFVSWSLKNRQCSQRCVGLNENTAFYDPYPHGHLFVAVEREEDPNVPYQELGYHAMVGFLPPNSSAMTTWIGARQNGVDKDDYPSLKANVYIFRLTRPDEVKKIKSVFTMAQAFSKTWKWQARVVTKDATTPTNQEPGVAKSAKTGNCVQFVHALLRDMNIEYDSLDEHPDVVTPEALEVRLEKLKFMSYVDVIQTEFQQYTVTEKDAEPIEREKRAEWNKVRALWNCNRVWKLAGCPSN